MVEAEPVYAFRSSDGIIAVPARGMTANERVWTHMALSLHAITEVAPVAAGMTLEPITRVPHRAYPTCHARSFPVSRRWRQRAEYPWCNDSARWQWGEQYLCVEHAAQLALGIRVPGISRDGKWE